jgi:hypothetical protein
LTYSDPLVPICFIRILDLSTHETVLNMYSTGMSSLAMQSTTIAMFVFA